jgi:hypothetical protein
MKLVTRARVVRRSSESSMQRSTVSGLKVPAKPPDSSSTMRRSAGTACAPAAGLTINSLLSVQTFSARRRYS